MPSNVDLHIAPKRALMDEPLNIRVVGLKSKQVVTVRAHLLDDAGVEWRSEAIYMADENGEIDFSSHAPQMAPFNDADPMGLIWSMTPVDETKRYEILAHNPDLAPIRITFSVHVNGRTVTSAAVERLYLAPGVQRIEVRENGLFGTLFIPAGKGPHPAITLVSGSGGGVFEYRAALYAAHGYAAFALAYFNYESLPKILVDIPLEYFVKAIHYLQAHPDIDGDRLGVTGGSRGGELSLLLGSIFQQYKVVIADVPSAIVWGGFGHDPAEGSKPAWVYQGKAIPYMDESDPEIYAYYSEYAERGEAIPGTLGFLETMRRGAMQMKNAAIQVEKINGAVLLISGEDDQMWPSAQLAEMAVARLKAHNFQHPYEHVSYPGAGHLITPPYGPTTMICMKHPVDGGFYTFGGEPEANYRASVDSWKRKLTFLKESL